MDDERSKLIGAIVSVLRGLHDSKHVRWDTFDSSTRENLATELILLDWKHRNEMADAKLRLDGFARAALTGIFNDLSVEPEEAAKSAWAAAMFMEVERRVVHSLVESDLDLNDSGEG
jgi:hypothetical protein